MSEKVRLLECFFMAPRGQLLPRPHSEGSDNHPFWQVLDECSERVAAEVAAKGIAKPHEWHWCIQYAADWCRSSYYRIPAGQIGEKRLAMILSDFSKARRIAPQLIWQKFQLDGIALEWDAVNEQFQLPYSTSSK